MKKNVFLLVIGLGISLCACRKNTSEEIPFSTEINQSVLQESVSLETDVSDIKTEQGIFQSDEPADIGATYNVVTSSGSNMSEEIGELIKIYSDFSVKENAKRMALIYFDEDSMPELLLLKDGEYRLYSYNGSEVKQITFEDETITANAYGFRHDFEYPEGLTFYWFEYVPYRGLLRVHESNEEERYDHYLKYADGTLIKELTAKSKDYNWYTYDEEKEISNEEFTSQLSNLGYYELVPCAYLYEDVMTAYENIERVSDSSKVLEDFVSGEIDAICAVEEINDIPENGFLMRSFDDLYEEITSGEEDWGSLEYVDYDNDGEEELILHGYAGSCSFLDVIGNSVYYLLKTSSTTDYGHVAEIDKKRVIERSDLSHVGRKYYWIMEYDSCGCLVDWFCLHVGYEGKKYSPEDVFWYRDKEISMEEFEAIVDSIQRIEGNIKTTD